MKNLQNEIVKSTMNNITKKEDDIFKEALIVNGFDLQTALSGGYKFEKQEMQDSDIVVYTCDGVAILMKEKEYKIKTTDKKITATIKYRIITPKDRGETK